MNFLSFDIEDWFHLLNIKNYKNEDDWIKLESRVCMNTLFILDELDYNKNKAIFFCLGWVASNFPDLIKEIKNRGHIIGTHSYSHKLIYQNSQYEFEKDLIKSLNQISKIINDEIIFYRAPGFSLKEDNFWAFDILRKNGIKCDSSIFPGLRFHGGIKKMDINKPFKIDTNYGSIIEFPISYNKIFLNKIFYSGGGYFRLLNYNIIKRLSQNNNYNMFYFHPRDFDYYQPRVKSNPISYFRNYVGLSDSKNKLRSLLNDLEFTIFEDKSLKYI